MRIKSVSMSRTEMLFLLLSAGVIAVVIEGFAPPSPLLSPLLSPLRTRSGWSSSSTTISTRTDSRSIAGAPPLPPATLSMVLADPPPSTSRVNIPTFGEWSPSSWRSVKPSPGSSTPGSPTYFANSTTDELSNSLSRLSRCAPLVFAGEVRSLQSKLSRACFGHGFVLMGGDVVENFDDFHVDNVRDTFRVLLQMALVLTYGAALPVVKVGRMAGQFVWPTVGTSGDGEVEVRNGISLPPYMGDMINSSPFNPSSRRPNPNNMVEAYHQSSQTLNILRAFSAGGYADISRLHAWNLDFAEKTEEGSRYRQFASKVDESLRFNRAIGIDTSKDPIFGKIDFYTGHDCLCLEYEKALTREDSITGMWYDCSAHLLVLDDTTMRRGDDLTSSAHIEFARGLNNPLGLKVTQHTDPHTLIDVIDALNPGNLPGRLSLFVHMSPESIRAKLPLLVRKVQRENKNILWIANPGYQGYDDDGNVREVEDDDFRNIRSELRAFFDVMDMTGAHPGGISLDMTGEDVTELKGGVFCDGVDDDENEECQTDHEGGGAAKIGRGTVVDDHHRPRRLGGRQALELAFLVAERMRVRTGLPPIE